MKTLVIDARMIGPVGHGIAKYVEDIARSLEENNELSSLFLRTLCETDFKNIRLIFLINKTCPPNSPVRNYQTIESETLCYHPKSWYEVPKILRHVKANLFFNTTFASYPYLPCRYIQTVHDLNHLQFGNVFQRIYYNTLVKRSILRASAVLTVSEFVKQEIRTWVRAGSFPVLVIYNQISRSAEPSSKVVQTVLNNYGLKAKSFFLCISNIKPHKNLLMLMRAHGLYMKNVGHQYLPLVVNAKENDFNEFFPGVKAIGGVSDEDLSVLYREAKAFFFPSKYEGFGRPPIEAALVGTPVYASDIPPHREGAEQFKLPIHFLDPKDQSAWVGAFANS